METHIKVASVPAGNRLPDLVLLFLLRRGWRSREKDGDLSVSKNSFRDETTLDRAFELEIQ